MRISRTVPKPPPEFTLTFTRDEGWAIVMALCDAAEKYRAAADREQWMKWGNDLYTELRRD